MSDDKPHDRFLHLERERARPLEEQLGPGSAERFGGAAQPEAEPAPQPEPAALPRFKDAEASVEVASNRAEEQPFVVCVRCNTEGGKFAERCHICNASFDTAEQRAHNEVIWAQRRAEREAERAAEEARHAAQLADQAELAKRQRGMGEAMARAVRSDYEERAAVDSLMGLGAAPVSRRLGRPPLLSLLGLVPSPWNWFVGTWLVVLPVLLVSTAERHSRAFAVGAVIGAVVMLMLIPPSLWTLHRRRWWE